MKNPKVGITAGKFRFTPEYLAANGGPIVEIRADDYDANMARNKAETTAEIQSLNIAYNSVMHPTADELAFQMAHDEAQTAEDNNPLTPARWGFFPGETTDNKPAEHMTAEEKRIAYARRKGAV